MICHLSWSLPRFAPHVIEIYPQDKVGMPTGLCHIHRIGPDSYPLFQDFYVSRVCGMYPVWISPGSAGISIITPYVLR